MKVAAVLYLKCVPGRCGTAWAMNDLAQTVSAAADGSSWCPVDIVSRSRTRIALRFALGAAGTSSGKRSTTTSLIDNLPSATANPTAVDVKLLLNEKKT